MDINSEGVWSELRVLATKREGAVLLMWLADEAVRRHLSLTTLGCELGMKSGSLREYYSGQRSTRFLTHKACIRLAEFLGVSVITVLFAAGIVTLGDFLVASDTRRRTATNYGKTNGKDWENVLGGAQPEESLFCEFLVGEAHGEIGLSKPTLSQQLEAWVRY